MVLRERLCDFARRLICKSLLSATLDQGSSQIASGNPGSSGERIDIHLINRALYQTGERHPAVQTCLDLYKYVGLRGPEPRACGDVGTEGEAHRESIGGVVVI